MATRQAYTQFLKEVKNQPTVSQLTHVRPPGAGKTVWSDPRQLPGPPAAQSGLTDGRLILHRKRLVKTSSASWNRLCLYPKPVMLQVL